MSDAMIQMAPGSRLDDERIYDLRLQWGELNGGPDYDSWIEGKLLQAEDEIDRLTRERDEAREAAKQLLGQTATFAEENEAIAKYPWLDYHA
jgi:hypothetical protein